MIVRYRERIDTVMRAMGRSVPRTREGGRSITDPAAHVYRAKSARKKIRGSKKSADRSKGRSWRATMKTCPGCGETKSFEAFYRHKTGPLAGRPTSYCKECAKRRATQRIAGLAPAALTRYRRRARLNTYGLTERDYQALLYAQDGQCAACGSRPEHEWELVVDHDHAAGRVRGLLCNKCNLTLGQAGEDHDRLIGLAAYLERTSISFISLVRR